MCLIKLLGNYAFKKESLGDGDIKLMAVITLGIGLYNSFITLFIACILGIIFAVAQKYKNKEGIIPFGPFLIMGTLIVLYFNSYVDYFWKLLM
jgi:leader peptidase (prepilin peptidase)/N-methyltransferase